MDAMSPSLQQYQQQRQMGSSSVSLSTKRFLQHPPKYHWSAGPFIVICLHGWHLELSTCRPKMHPEPAVFQLFYEVGLSVFVSHTTSVLLIWFSGFLNSRKTVRSKLLDQKQFWREHFLVVYSFHIQCVGVYYSAEPLHTYLPLHRSTVEYFWTELELLTGLSGGLDLMKSRISSWAFLFTLVGMSPPTCVRWETPHSL